MKMKDFYLVIMIFACAPPSIEQPQLENNQFESLEKGKCLKIKF